MKNGNARETSTLRILQIVAAFALVSAVAAAVPHKAYAQPETVPEVPVDIVVPEGNTLFIVGHAVGTQNYICLPAGSVFSWILFGPQATLFDGGDKQVMTHFISPNPDEAGTLRATWQHSRTTSAVWGQAVAVSTDPLYVAQGAIPWLRLQVVGSEDDPTGDHRLTSATFIQRLNTVGGSAPTTGCALATDVGKRVFVPYAADYFFYRAAARP
jgi:hypothetical protein